MKYLDKKFSSPGNSRAFVDNWDSVFGEEKPKQDEKPEPVEPVVVPDPAASE